MVTEGARVQERGVESLHDADGVLKGLSRIEKAIQTDSNVTLDSSGIIEYLHTYGNNSYACLHGADLTVMLLSSSTTTSQFLGENVSFLEQLLCSRLAQTTDSAFIERGMTAISLLVEKSGSQLFGAKGRALRLARQVLSNGSLQLSKKALSATLDFMGMFCHDLQFVEEAMIMLLRRLRRQSSVSTAQEIDFMSEMLGSGNADIENAAVKTFISEGGIDILVQLLQRANETGRPTSAEVATSAAQMAQNFAALQESRRQLQKCSTKPLICALRAAQQRYADSGDVQEAAYLAYANLAIRNSDAVVQMRDNFVLKFLLENHRRRLNLSISAPGENVSVCLVLWNCCLAMQDNDDFGLLLCSNHALCLVADTLLCPDHESFTDGSIFASCGALRELLLALSRTRKDAHRAHSTLKEALPRLASGLLRAMGDSASTSHSLVGEAKAEDMKNVVRSANVVEEVVVCLLLLCEAVADLHIAESDKETGAPDWPYIFHRCESAIEPYRSGNKPLKLLESRLRTAVEAVGECVSAAGGDVANRQRSRCSTM